MSTQQKTGPTDADVTDFLVKVEDAEKRADCQSLVDLMKRVTGHQPQLWGGSIIGFGNYHYKYASGREGDWPLVGFSPRKSNLTVYIMAGFDRYEDLMKKLGKHSVGKSCLYIKRLADVDGATLEELIRESVEHTRKTYA